MLLPIESHMVYNTIIPMIDNGTAERVERACFRDGNEDEYHFLDGQFDAGAHGSSQGRQLAGRHRAGH
jgi:hypothetical protein